MLAVPAAAAMAVLLWLRRRVPVPAAYERGATHARAAAAPAGALPLRFWLYAGYAALNMVGFATWAVLAFHLQQRHVVALSVIPVMYALAMGAAALGALASGIAYDRVGLAGLAVMPLLTALVPFLSFSTGAGLVWAGAVVWGFGLGVHESTMRAAVADLLPAGRRGRGLRSVHGGLRPGLAGGEHRRRRLLRALGRHRGGLRGRHPGRRDGRVRAPHRGQEVTPLCPR